MKYIISILILIGHLSFASAQAKDLCWTKEENPATKQPYSSFEEWDTDVYKWKRKFHSQFNLFSLAKAYSSYLKERAKADSFANDKVAHCYIGCRISQSANYKTARFAAWYKELKDITDCRQESHFEEQDYDATLMGAEVGKSSSTKCDTICPALILQK